MNITAKGLTKIYGSGENRVVALDKADLQIASKEFISIMGPSGSGKSTLLHLLSGLDRPSSGSLTYDGRDIYSMATGSCPPSGAGASVLYSSSLTCSRC